MCNKCNEDPRENIDDAEKALAGLSILLSELGSNGHIRAVDIAPLVGLIHERLEGATDAIQNYVPRV